MFSAQARTVAVVSSLLVLMRARLYVILTSFLSNDAASLVYPWTVKFAFLAEIYYNPGREGDASLRQPVGISKIKNHC